jgi:hypothetical protein
MRKIFFSNLKSIGAIALMCGLGFAAYSQTGYEGPTIWAAEAYVNGCGPASMQWAVPALNALSGNVEACNQHDLDYITLGMSKDDADNRLYNALKRSSGDAKALASWALLRNPFGDNAYKTAQRQGKEEFRRIHHGNDWNSRYGSWKPSDGHIKTAFPQCTPSCFSANLGQTSPEQDFGIDIFGTIAGYFGSGGAVVIPARIRGVQVQAIDDCAFIACNSITSVVIPPSVTSIGFSAFTGCENLKSVIIPSSVTSIGFCAFMGCSNLSYIELSRRTHIGIGAFDGVPGRLQYRD